MSTNDQTPTPVTPYDDEIAELFATFPTAEGAAWMKPHEFNLREARTGWLRRDADVAPRLAAADALARAVEANAHRIGDDPGTCSYCEMPKCDPPEAEEYDHTEDCPLALAAAYRAAGGAK
jgi:hypothetical protein